MTPRVWGYDAVRRNPFLVRRGGRDIKKMPRSIRFENKELYDNLEGVLETIKQALQK